MLIRRLPSFPTWSSALRGLDDVRREMDRLFESFSDVSGMRSSGVFPAINVTETTDKLLVRAEMPGIKPSDLDVTVENNTLTIAGERSVNGSVQKASYHRREREWGTFRRSFTLPIPVRTDAIQARYVDGILTVEMPKPAEAQPRQIPIEAGS